MWLDVLMDINRHSEARHREGKIVRGREILAIIMQSFRSSDRTDLVYHIDHLLQLEFPGGKNLTIFRNKWYDILANMRAEDIPSNLTLRDILYKKIKGSKKMEYLLMIFQQLPDSHPDKSYRNLVTMIDRQIRIDREEAMLENKEKTLKNIVKGNNAAPSVEKEEKGDKPGKDKPPKNPNKAAPVMPKPKAKPHAKATPKAAGKDDGKGKDGDKVKGTQPCWHHFKSNNGCRKTDKCEYSHKKKDEAKLKEGKGKGKGKSRSSSPVGAPGVCFSHRDGKCKWGDKCKFSHDLSNTAASSTPRDDKKPKAKAAPAGGGGASSSSSTTKPAAPAILRRRAMAMPVLLRKAVSSDKVKQEYDGAETECPDTEFGHDAMSESSRLSGETEAPMRIAWVSDIVEDEEGNQLMAS